MNAATTPPPPPQPASTPPGGWVGLVATFFYAGRLPGAPGTYGTLAAMPLTWVLWGLGRPALLGCAAALLALGTLAASRYCTATGRHDNQQIVIDEVVGYMLTVCLVPRSIWNALLALGLFRLFDIWKPGPIRWVDRHVPGGFGVMADDLAAGAVGAAVLYLLQPLVQHVLGWIP